MDFRIFLIFCSTVIVVVVVTLIGAIPLEQQQQPYRLEKDSNNNTIAVDLETNEVVGIVKTAESQQDDDSITPEEQAEQIKKMVEWVAEDVDIRLFSLSVDFENIKFLLFTRKKPTSYLLKIGNDDTLKASTFNKTKKTKILIHGWIQKGHSFIDSFKTVYLKNQDVNLIFVDWGEYSRNEYQYTIMKIVPRIGEAVELMIKQLIAYGASVSEMHLIGFSLGAHISSLAVKNMNPKVARITGLDPAGIGYTGVLRQPRLSRTDADFVDVIHTSGRGGGLTAAIGDVDFYPNGGNVQPGCIMGNVICYHFRSLELFEESIENRTHFYSASCSNYNDYSKNLCSTNNQQIMGEYTSSRISGSYYLLTNSQAPYAMGRQDIITTWRPPVIEAVDD